MGGTQSAWHPPFRSVLYHRASVTLGRLATLNDASPHSGQVRRYDLTSFQSGLVVSSSLGGALVGSVGAFVFGDKLGRRKELLLAATLYGATVPM